MEEVNAPFQDSSENIVLSVHSNAHLRSPEDKVQTYLADTKDI